VTKRRMLSTAFKKKVALAALCGDQTIQALATHYQAHPNQISQWKRQAIDGLDETFDNKKTSRVRDVDAEVKELHAKIGELTMVNSFLESCCD